MLVTINGENYNVKDTVSNITELLEELNLSKTPVLIEKNKEAIFTRNFNKEKVSKGDKFEIIKMVAGG